MLELVLSKETRHPCPVRTYITPFLIQFCLCGVCKSEIVVLSTENSHWLQWHCRGSESLQIKFAGVLLWAATVGNTEMGTSSHEINRLWIRLLTQWKSFYWLQWALDQPIKKLVSPPFSSLPPVALCSAPYLASLSLFWETQTPKEDRRLPVSIFYNQKKLIVTRTWP